MRVISLWNADHLNVPSFVTTPTPLVLGCYNTVGQNSNLMVTGSGASAPMWNTTTNAGRNFLSLQPAVVSTPGLTMYVSMCPAIAGMSFPGVTLVYQGLQIRTQTVASSPLLWIGSTGFLNATSNTDYFIEVVTNLVAGTRTVYVNGTAYTAGAPTSMISIGSYTGLLMTAGSQGFSIANHWCVVGDTGEVNMPTRLGRLAVKSSNLESVSNDAKFTPVGGSSIVDTLNLKRPAVLSSPANYVATDSFDSKMGLKFVTPTAGDPVIGAMLRVVASKDLSSEATTVATVEGVEATVTTVLNTAAQQIYAGAIIPNPVGGWSEAALGSLDLKISSKRNA